MLGMVHPLFALAAAAGGAYTTLDPLDTHASITLSNGNLTATKNGTDSVAWAVAAHGKSTGKWVFEFTITATSAEMTIGLAGVGGMPAKTYLGHGDRSIGVATNPNSIFSSNSSLYSAGGVGTGTVFHVYCDVDAGKVWFARNGTVLNGDPVAGTGGTTMSNMPKAWYPIASLYKASSAVTFNFGATAFAYPTLSGFSAWSAVDHGLTLAGSWRAVRMNFCNGGWFGYLVAEWELMTSSGGSTIFSGGTASASESAIGGYPISNLFDGNTATSGGVNGMPGGQDKYGGWFGYDFGSSATRSVSHMAQRARQFSDGAGAELQALTLIDLYLSTDNVVFWKVKPRVAFSAFAQTTPGQRQVVAL